ncbi:translation initiation factor IF-2 [Synechococcus sp. Cruz-9H2]|uniref:translation initiation factor IF-2 n=1 Tax=unclassified Synechococcus TaxID=2626047 RepID=UPI0020CFCBF5|nr:MULTISPECIES: translation initiation factor IF-2 [unclassified Synechococcus]MCP9819048.1 translation initiation factor IF-2 [Synechococcus sp. Cruz-9H2]MCP9843552.1 translation initiation factor IF-2 [Synechococcus sp. Edmonson 11F2]MCP9855729.1 translation initiation factor IF-2 [Synechococcus sp. Cruz-9C9]MCP9863167.1 translation initiation factor IF-2 [Synechococcus sp. Cruz-7E5]MCP9869958.1 translation initiation factor IF-2 [Synechococcus sp. Cruz-7B9]
MTSSGKVRIYELSRDLGLENKDVLDAAEKLSIAVKSHSSSISDGEAERIRSLISTPANGGGAPASQPVRPTPPASEPAKTILSLKKAAPAAAATPASPAGAAKPKPAVRPASSPQKPAAPAPAQVAKPTIVKPAPRPEIVAQAPAAAPKPAAPTPPATQLPAVRKVVPQANLQSPTPAAPARPVSPLKPAALSASQAKPASAPSRPPAPPVSKPEPPQVRKPESAAAASPSPRPATSPRPVPRGSSAPTPAPSRPASPQRPGAPAPVRSTSGAGVGRPQLVGRPQPGQPGTSNRPAPPSGRPALSQRPAGAPQRPTPQVGRPTQARSPLELVGKPIRRDAAGPAGTSRPGAPVRPGMPQGMRKPVAPGELMQLQKPGSRPVAAPPRRPERSESSPEAPRPTATPPAAPRRPAFRTPQAAGPGRARRPEWDDSAKLEALRSKSPQKQRQKVHIIGDNDDALTAETGGFAGEHEAMVLQASLARPAKPRTRPTTPGAKPVVAMRKRKKETTRQRQRRRAMELRAAREAKATRPEMLIVPEGNLTVQELADRLGVESSEIIKSLFFKGIIATVTQTLDLSTIETVSDEFGVPVLQDDVEEAAKKTVEMIEDSDLAHLIRRPPVVTVMGHVDHGKTSLLDAIRKTRVAAGEAGGITQHIGAYQVTISNSGESRRITFLDTPGHEAFTAMRARGTKVTDVAVLVVAADDGVRPQTLEAISHARAAEVPIIVAINKIDKEGAQPERVKQELSALDLVSEDWGGNTVMVPVSATKGENIDKLLEMILLVTEVEDLQANPDRMAKGTVIEAHLDKAKGPVATLLIQNGTLKAGDVLAAGPVLGKVRAMVDDTGKRVKTAGPSSAVEALGFSEVPTAGDEFEVYPDEKTARSVVGDRANEARATRLAQQMASRRVSLASMSGQASEGELKELNLILKADVQGSVEAILGSLEQLPQGEVQVRVLLSAPGEITETDVDLAAASGAVIVGFNTSMASGAKRAADANGVDVRDYDVIYKLLEDIQLAMEGLLEPELVEEPLGEAEVRAVFTIGKSAVAGCYVTSGKLQRNCKVRIQRNKQVVFEGDLDSLRRNKDDVKEVATGFECGIGCDRFANWQDGDRVMAYKLVTQRRTLST